MTPECQNLPCKIYIFLTLVQWIFAAFSLIRKWRIWATTGDTHASKSSEREAQLRHGDLLEQMKGVSVTDQCFLAGVLSRTKKDISICIYLLSVTPTVLHCHAFD